MHSPEERATLSSLSLPSSSPSAAIVLPSVESLCPRCRYDEHHYPTTNAAKAHSNNVCKNTATARQAALDGCWLCAILLAATRLWNLGVQQDEKHGEFHVRYDAERFTLRPRFLLPIVQIYSVGKPQALRFISDTELPAQASSPITANFIAYNLNRCLHTHSACREYQTRLASCVNWPKRVLRINSTGQKLQLVDFDPSMASRYTALSYCWGDADKQFSATSKTLPSLLAGVDISDLPQTLRDAVSVTTSLGTDLIWIDSMCIIQDDIDDWRREAGKMSVVYALALVTIIASSASACDKGFLSAKRETSIHLAHIDVEGQATELRARIIRDWGHHRGGPQSHYNYRSIMVDPVDTRAWTLQERLLSARFITYTSGETQWGCRTLNACECGQRLYGDLYKEARDPEDYWFDTVQEYLSRNLTQQADKVTAIAGIARMTASSFLDAQYVAGIWTTQPNMSQLAVRGLLWYRTPLLRARLLPTTFTAPSFSWASTIGDVYHYEAGTFKDATFPSRIVEVGKKLESSDRFGRVSEAYMRMAGPVLHAKLTAPPETHYTQYTARLDRARSYAPQVNFDAKLEKVQLPDGGFTVRRSPWPADGETPKVDEHWDDEIDIRFLPLRIRRGRDLGNGFKYSADCLILARSVEHPGYERIGIVTSVDWEEMAKLEPEEAEIRIY